MPLGRIQDHSRRAADWDVCGQGQVLPVDGEGNSNSSKMEVAELRVCRDFQVARGRDPKETL